LHLSERFFHLKVSVVLLTRIPCVELC